eukprot:gb/GFBE01052082.1/.p1 GENE.gb/GFBE01052082.1/~~gb/GFBE01052082.1/.p1  ORF type:complete len:268 (+),score=65.46 gb/GFBE01052082.1/:1-804(+)
MPRYSLLQVLLSFHCLLQTCAVPPLPALIDGDGCNALVQTKARALPPRDPAPAAGVDEGPLLTALDGTVGQASLAADSVSKDAVALVSELQALTSVLHHSESMMVLPPQLEEALLSPPPALYTAAAMEEDAPTLLAKEPTAPPRVEAVVMPQLAEAANTTSSTTEQASDSEAPSAEDVKEALKEAADDALIVAGSLWTFGGAISGTTVVLCWSGIGLALALLVVCCCCGSRTQKLKLGSGGSGAGNPAKAKTALKQSYPSQSGWDYH